ncbi:HPF/RaiA family ribosome-associated protein [Roseateles sp.]|uniref:HPF/RaiA family ribosome-associated protein n=1 Tax=Roseateles sp. TaxID=1971397 RepID=UPI003D0D91B7
MQVHFESRDPEGARLRELVVERLRFALRRVDLHPASAHISLSDTNGPRGGVDKRCTLSLNAQGAGHLVIHASASSWRASFELALARLARSLVRAWQRQRSHPRQNNKRLLPATAAE